MRAAVYHGPRDIRIEDVPRPRPAPGEVLVRVHANGICGTDASEYAGAQMYPLHARHGLTGHQGPLIPGHEFAGRIAEVGDGVEGFTEGEPVVTGAALWCGVCAQCHAGRTSICAAMSRRDESETVTTAGRARATRSCMPKKPYQRRVVKRCQGFVVWDRSSSRSTVMNSFFCARSE